MFETDNRALFLFRAFFPLSDTGRCSRLSQFCRDPSNRRALLDSTSADVSHADRVWAWLPHLPAVASDGVSTSTLHGSGRRFVRGSQKAFFCCCFFTEISSHSFLFFIVSLFSDCSTLSLIIKLSLDIEKSDAGTDCRRRVASSRSQESSWPWPFLACSRHTKVRTVLYHNDPKSVGGVKRYSAVSQVVLIWKRFGGEILCAHSVVT